VVASIRPDPENPHRVVCGTPSLTAQGGQRRSSDFNIAPERAPFIYCDGVSAFGTELSPIFGDGLIGQAAVVVG
jgi:hypothetical protein